MAGGMDLGGGGKGKKPLDMNVNLVPFIDLMAVTIVFLIMTAVWTQLGRLQVSQAGQNTSEQQDEQDKKPPVNLLITEKDMKLTLGGNPVTPEPIAFDRDDKQRIKLEKLTEGLKKIRTEVPDQQAITLQTEDGVKYEDLVRIIDACIGSDFPSVSVSPAST